MTNTTRDNMDLEWTMIVVFVILKLTGIITWSWWWLLGIMFFYPTVLVMIIVVVALAVATVMIAEEFMRFLYKMFVGK